MSGTGAKPEAGRGHAGLLLSAESSHQPAPKRRLHVALLADAASEC
jgi:hypothetical protein